MELFLYCLSSSALLEITSETANVRFLPVDSCNNYPKQLIKLQKRAPFKDLALKGKPPAHYFVQQND